MPPSRQHRQRILTVDQYLSLDTSRYVEFTSGVVEFLPSPDESHCEVQRFLYEAATAHLRSMGRGVAICSPFAVRIAEATFRMPDVSVMLNADDRRRGRQYWSGADLVMEVVSDRGRRRDYDQKRLEYAAAGIPEYWIADPYRQELFVLNASAKQYEAHGPLRAGDVAVSRIVEGFQIDVRACFAVLGSVSPHKIPPSVNA